VIDVVFKSARKAVEAQIMQQILQGPGESICMYNAVQYWTNPIFCTEALVQDSLNLVGGITHISLMKK
jgi:hypothetical protein